jgi:putative transposase
MKRSRFTEVQVAYALRQAEAGMPVIDVCRSLGISEATISHLEEEVWRPGCQRGQTVAPA